MDDTQLSRASDAAATRKRRSSILKSQKPARTPFSELEFNVATPTDSAKSRRVSFSRRTGVAEFVTNEATTTWKNFYEEHNKSAESSGNDSGSKQSVGHLGKRVFDLQFEEVEADFIGTLNTGPNINISSSLCNFEQQLASLECTDDIKLTAPLNNFELSALTNNHTKLFDDFAICGEVTDPINVNFSAVQRIGEVDDLDEIQRDLKQNFANASFQRQNVSEYIEVDLNMTNVMRKEDDMSITDTVHSPKVQDISKKSKSNDEDWQVDKENIVMNPYSAPREDANFAINDETDKVLVFDGKRLTVQSEKDRETLQPNAQMKAPQRKTIVLNVNDDLPNFVDDLQKSNTSGFIGIDLKKSLIIDDTSIEPEIKQRTVLYDDDFGNISVTQAVPTNIIAEKLSIAFHNSNISLTQALPTNIVQEQQNEKRKTIIFDDGNISMTQALPVNILTEKTSKRRTIVYEDNAGNLSITQAVPNILIKEAKADKRRTILYEDDTGNISVTQAVPSNIIFDDNATDRRRTVVFESDTGNISVTQAVPSSLLQEQAKNAQAKITNKRRTIVFENDACNLSITQAVPNQVIQGYSNLLSSDDKVTSEATAKRKTIIFDNDDADISVTQAVSLNQVICAMRNEQKETANDIKENLIKNTNLTKNNAKRRTVVFDNDDADMSMTQAVPINVIHSINHNDTSADLKTETDKHHTVIFENEDANISITHAVINQVLPGLVKDVHDDLEDALNEALHNKNAGKSRRTIVFDKENDNVSLSQNLQDKDVNIKLSCQDNVIEDLGKRRTIVSDDINICMSQDLPANIIETEAKESSLSNDPDLEMHDVSMTDINVEDKDAKQDEIIRKSFNPEPKLDKSVTNPITNLSTKINSKDELKSVINDDIKSEVEPSKKVSNVFVYQAALTKRTEQGDSKSQEPIIDSEEKMSSSSKIADVIETDEKLSSSSKVTEAKQIKEPETTNDLQIEYKETEMTEENQPEIHDNQSEASSQMSKSILNDLLDMSSAEAVDEKGLMTQKDTDSEKFSTAKTAEVSSNDTLFYITKDGEDEAQIQTDNVLQITDHSPLPLEYRETELVSDLQNKLEDLKDAVNEENRPKNRHYEKIISPDLVKSKMKEFKESKGFRTANDTNELLEMLSDLTDKTMTRKLDAHLEEDNELPAPILVKGHLAIENKSQTEPEPKRLSFAPRRQSIVMSREDILNNISMAGAALKSRLDFDSELEDTINEDKSARLSNEVVKTLHFDESISESSIHSETMISPLKKTAFGETSYMQEHKSKVIPDYLKDVSDGIKELMDDLVKPNADVLPFDGGRIDKGVIKIPSTCSTQIQANLVTSSQIDINAGLYSNSDSVYDVKINKISSVDMINDAVNRSVSRALKSPIKSATATRVSEKSFDSKMDVSTTDVRTIIPSKPKEQSPGRVLIFDHNNPLNNISFAPESYTEVHRYNPGDSTETICVSERSNSVQISLDEKEKDYEVERVSTQYNVGSLLHSVQQSGDATSGLIAESQSIVSNISKPMSIDQSTDAKLNEVKDTEVNTLIAMKGNRELLDASSSLTLVDDALARSTFDVDIDTRTTTSQEDMAKSPVRVIYSVDHDDLLSVNMDSDFTSNDEDDRKSKKRIYSPTKLDKHKHCTISSLDVTPKPTVKMQKMSQSPDGFKPIDTSQSEKSEIKKKSPFKSKCKKPGSSITVQRLMTEYNIGPIDHAALDEQIKEVLRDPRSDNSSIEPTQTASQSDVQECNSLDVVSSFTSSKNLREGSALESQSSKVSRMDWQADLTDAMSSKNPSECDSSVNVVAKIDMLPFMGSHECEWESSSGDTWTFRLLHARLRLIVRLAHRHDNATRTRVRADTPVRNVALEVLPHDTRNSLAALCVTFAAETMRYFISQGCASAGDVPSLAKRCAASARLAARWGRAMSEARASLAYCLTPDATLTLKVANIPLRCVWEVTMRLELVVGDAREAPWVRAGGVRVRRVLPACADVLRLPRVLKHLPRDWSHAPASIWRIFKYLKHKTRDDNELFIGL